MDVFYPYTYGTCGWMFLQAAPLIISPRLIVAMLAPEIRDATDLEVYFARSCGGALIALGILCVLLTGSVPLSSRLAVGATGDAEDPKAPYALPTLTITTMYHAFCAAYSWASWTSTGVTSFALGVAGSSFLAAIGGWTILFGSSNGRISRKTGADKRTSSYPFKNVEAEKKKGR